MDRSGEVLSLGDAEVGAWTGPGSNSGHEKGSQRGSIMSMAHRDELRQYPHRIRLCDFPEVALHSGLDAT
jgi:hypothetical protein